MKYLTLLITYLWLSIACANAANLSLGYEKFGHLPMIQSPVISPDGNKIAAVFNSPDGPSVVLSDFGSDELTTIVKLKKSQDRIEYIYWVNSTRLLVAASYSQRIADRRFRTNRIFSVNTDGSELIELKYKMPKQIPDWERRASADITLTSLLKSDDKHVILQVFDRRDQGQAVFKVNVYENKFTKLFTNKYNVHTWVANDKGEVTFGYGTDEHEPDVNTIWVRESGNAPWKLIRKEKAFQSDSFSPIFVKGDELFVISDYKTRRQSLWKYNIKTGEFKEKLFGHDTYDVKGVIYNADRNDVIGAIYYDHHKKDHYFNAEHSRTSILVKNSFKNYHTSIYTRSKDNKRMLILASSDNSPTKFFWLDLTAKKAGMWFSQYPYLEGKVLPPVSPIEFSAKDGTKLAGYLTLPNTEADEKPPLIIWPHGGPIGVRDYQTFDPYVQFFASKGFAVLQVNYRGSGGFGSDFETSGYRQWGKLMQTDVYDGLEYVKSLNLIDTNKMCFAGYSYGGYAALTAAFQRPNEFKCIVSIAGIADLYELADNDYQWRGNIRAHIVNTIGDPNDEKIESELKSLSASYNIDKIVAPMLLIHGRYDTRVRVSQSSEFYDLAKNSGKTVEYIEFEHGTHFLDEGDNRLAAFKALEEFLIKHLGE
ncbi:prolyl oligopeptidase family serine peptidase [Thalassotalea fusca]